MRQWFTMKAEDDKTAEIYIYDEIGTSWWGEETVSAKSFVDELKALGDVTDITLRINSPGGDVFDGVTIHNAIKTHKATVTAHVDGLAASAASYIAMAADNIVMPSNSFMLIHGASGMSWGNADDMRAVAEDLDRIDKSLTATYVARSNTAKVKISALHEEDRLMDAAEAKDWGFADEVTQPVKMAANYSLRLLPKAAADRIHAEIGEGNGGLPEPIIPEPVVEPVVKPVELPAPAIKDPPTAQVVTLDAAKKQGIEEHRTYVSSVTDLCTLAKTPERVGGYVRANTPVDQVRKELLTMRAQEPVIMPHHPLVPAAQVSSTAWGKITDKINARLKK